jgi:hypothetical protein
LRAIAAACTEFQLPKVSNSLASFSEKYEGLNFKKGKERREKSILMSSVTMEPNDVATTTHRTFVLTKKRRTSNVIIRAISPVRRITLCNTNFSFTCKPIPNGDSAMLTEKLKNNKITIRLTSKAILLGIFNRLVTLRERKIPRILKNTPAPVVNGNEDETIEIILRSSPIACA